MWRAQGNDHVMTIKSIEQCLVPQSDYNIDRTHKKDLTFPRSDFMSRSPFPFNTGWVTFLRRHLWYVSVQKCDSNSGTS